MCIRDSECTINSEVNLTITQNCACDASGVCTVGIQGGPEHYNGAASFAYTVSTNGLTSNSAVASISIFSLPDAPTTEDFVSASVLQDTETIITLPYESVDNSNANSCFTTIVSNVTVTTPCTCTAGECSVGVTGTPGYTGLASFDYAVNAGQNSNISTVSFGTVSYTHLTLPTIYSV